MGEMLRNSVSSPIFLNGFSLQHLSTEARNRESRMFYRNFGCRFCCSSAKRIVRRNAKGIHGLNMMTVSNKGNILFDVTRLRLSRFGVIKMEELCVVSEKMAGVRTGCVCREMEETSLVQQGNEEVNGNYNEMKLPRGYMDIYKHSDLETKSVNEPSRPPERLAVDKKRVHFLEERDQVVLSHRLLMLSRSNKVRSALELFGSMELSGLQPNVHACNSFLSCLIRNDLLNDALRIYEYMKRNKTTSGHSHSLILKAVANAQSSESAFEIFWKSEADCRIRKDFDVIVYNTMISISGKVDDWVQSEKIWRHMKENGHIGTKITYRLLVCIFVRSDRNDLAIDAYNEMVQNGLEPGEDAMQAVIGACSREGNWELALSVFQNMLNSKLKPNSIACNALINLLGKSGKVEFAIRVYRIMESLSHTPDTYTWNALLGSLYKENRHVDVLQLFENIKREKRSQMNIHLYNTALMSCRKLRLWEKALQILWEMETAGLSVSTASYNLVIGACEVARKPKTALQVYEHMIQQDCNPDTFTYLSLIRCCIWGSLWDEVEDIVNQVAPDASLYNTVIQGMCLRGKTDQAKKLYTKMHSYGLSPDGKTRALMLQSYKKNVRKGFKGLNRHR